VCGLDSDSDGFPDVGLDCDKPQCKQVTKSEPCFIDNNVLYRISVLTYIVSLVLVNKVHRSVHLHLLIQVSKVVRAPRCELLVTCYHFPSNRVPMVVCILILQCTTLFQLQYHSNVMLYSLACIDCESVLWLKLPWDGVYHLFQNLILIIIIIIGFVGCLLEQDIVWNIKWPSIGINQVAIQKCPGGSEAEGILTAYSTA